MLTFHKLLFPVDFSARCIDALPYVAQIARKFGSEVVLLNVFDMNYPFGDGATSSEMAYGGAEVRWQEQRQAALADFGKDALTGLVVSRVVEFGEPAECITRYSEDQGIDLVFMPTHGRGRFRKLLLGSVTSKVLHDARCAVWTTAHAELLAGDSSQEIRSIVCGVDFSPETPEVFCAARDMAQQFGSVLRLVHAIPSLDFGPEGVVEGAPFQRFLFDTASQRMDVLQKNAQTHFETSIMYGTVAMVLREGALNCSAQLTVIGRGRLTKLLGRLRTNVGAIIRESPCPVLSV